MKYTYVDGSGNQYILENSILSYDPMTPELSSSGTYSGGSAFTTKLEKLDVIKFIDVSERAFWDETDHANKKSLGNGTLIKEIALKIQRIYLKYNSDSMKNIDSFLKDIKSKLIN